MAQMGLLQTQQLEKQHVQQWQAGTLPKIQQPVNLYASSLCAYLSASLPLGCNANNTQPQTYLTSLSLMGQLLLSPSLEIVFISFIRQFNWMSKMLTKHRRRLSKITLCSSLRLCDYHCTNCLSFEGPTKTKNKKKERKKKKTVSPGCRCIMAPPSEILSRRDCLCLLLDFAGWKFGFLSKLLYKLTVCDKQEFHNSACILV